MGNTIFAKSIVIFSIVCAMAFTVTAQKSAANGKKYAPKPVQIGGLRKGLADKSVTTADIIKYIEANGVSFKLDSDLQDRLRKSGATEEIFQAINKNYRTDLDEKAISGGVMNNRATELPQPVTPPAARVVRASGVVTVSVLVAEDGGVLSAQAVSGHPLLRNAAEDAAELARFKPLMLSGKPQIVRGIITYNFVP